MRAVESLFEFMPYGAPDLLQTRRERLASATLLSSLAVAALFLAAGVAARWLVVLPVEIPRPYFEPHDLQRPPVVNSPRSHAPVPQVRVPVTVGVPVPVPDPEAPPEVAPGADAGAKVIGPDTMMGEPDQAQVAPGEGALPGLNDYVPVEELPEPVTVITPAYPTIAQQAGVEGLVVVKVLVGKNGRVLDVRLDEKRQAPLLNEAALAAAREWRFTPALSNGKPVAVWTAIPFHFQLHD